MIYVLSQPAQQAFPIELLCESQSGSKKKVDSFPSPSPVIHFFFCSCPSFLDEPREETLATQASTFCDNQPESLTHFFYHCSRSKQFWIEFELYWCLISNQRIRLCLENVLFGILTENACPLLQLLNYFIIIGKLYLWDCRSKQILPNIYGFRAKIIGKYETEEKISKKEFFKRKWILTPYLR